MSQEIEYNNIDNIIKVLKDATQCIKTYRKLDGITFECESLSPSLFESAKNEIQAMSKKYGFMPVSIQDNKFESNLFAVQYPELIPIYSDEDFEKMYKDNFKFLFDNIRMKDPKGFTKNMLYDNMETMTKHAITIYCKSNTNRYKENLDDFLNDKKYRLRVNTIYITYIDEYFIA